MFLQKVINQLLKQIDYDFINLEFIYISYEHHTVSLKEAHDELYEEKTVWAKEDYQKAAEAALVELGSDILNLNATFIGNDWWIIQPNATKFYQLDHYEIYKFLLNLEFVAEAHQANANTVAVKILPNKTHIDSEVLEDMGMIGLLNFKKIILFEESCD